LYCVTFTYEAFQNEEPRSRPIEAWKVASGGHVRALGPIGTRATGYPAKRISIKDETPRKADMIGLLA
jgi:hypothetical protein